MMDELHNNDEFAPLLNQRTVDETLTSITHDQDVSPRSKQPSPPAMTDGTALEENQSIGITTTTERLIDPSKDSGDMNEYSRGKQILLFVIMLLVNVLGPLSTEAQVPALSDIADDLNTTSTWVQLTITIYMLSFGISQLFFGTLSDMFGRRNTLIAGLVIYVSTNAGCALSPNIAALNVFRAIQAMGSGTYSVVLALLFFPCDTV